MKIVKTTLFIVVLSGMSLLMLYLNQNTTLQEGKISVEKVLKAPYIDEVTPNETVLLFFGYVGCSEVCTPFLDEMHTLYRTPELDETREKLDFLFINLLSEVDPGQADEFAKAFDEEFKGVYLSKQELRKVDREFGLIFSPSVFDKSTINHTDYLYLLQRAQKGEWLLKNFYLIHPLNKALLIKDIQQLAGEDG